MPHPVPLQIFKSKSIGNRSSPNWVAELIPVRGTDYVSDNRLCFQITDYVGLISNLLFVIAEGENIW